MAALTALIGGRLEGHLAVALYRRARSGWFQASNRAAGATVRVAWQVGACVLIRLFDSG